MLHCCKTATVDLFHTTTGSDGSQGVRVHGLTSLECVSAKPPYAKITARRKDITRLSPLRSGFFAVISYLPSRIKTKLR